MRDIEYSDKELAIFNGLISLIENGANLYKITVAEIAKAADVGKGTIYDYFKTKEEAISKAILYNIENEIKSSIGRIDLKHGFKNKYYEMLNIIIESYQNKYCTMNMLLSVGGFQEFYDYLVDEKHSMPLYLSIVEEAIDNFLETGFKERIITIDEHDYYKRMVIKSSISGFADYINVKDHYSEIGIEEAMDLSYKMILKSLN